MKPPLIILAGPTAIGKTALSVQLAEDIGGQIISADSMQVYQGMDIGTAKITNEEMCGVPHHLIDILQPNEPFNVYLFQSLAKQAIANIRKNKQIPILTGGTGFYIQALLYDIDFSQGNEGSSYRESLERLASEKGTIYLHSLLKDIDSASYETIHPNNQKRVIRALEYYKETGKPISSHNQEQKEKESPYHCIYFVLHCDRAKLYKRIDERVDLMIQNGLLAEVQELKKNGFGKELISMQGIGYHELLSYLDGEMTLEQAIYKIKQETRHFAKRQITWFKREKNVIWLNTDEYETPQDILSCMMNHIKERGILT